MTLGFSPRVSRGSATAPAQACLTPGSVPLPRKYAEEPKLHIRMSGPHIFIKAGLDKDQRLFHLSAVFIFLVT